MFKCDIVNRLLVNSPRRGITWDVYLKRARIEQLMMPLIAFCYCVSFNYIPRACINVVERIFPQIITGRLGRTWRRQRWESKLLQPMRILYCMLLSFPFPYEYNGVGIGSSQRFLNCLWSFIFLVLGTLYLYILYNMWNANNLYCFRRVSMDTLPFYEQLRRTDSPHLTTGLMKVIYHF